MGFLKLVARKQRDTSYLLIPIYHKSQLLEKTALENHIDIEKTVVPGQQGRDLKLNKALCLNPDLTLECPKTSQLELLAFHTGKKKKYCLGGQTQRLVILDGIRHMENSINLIHFMLTMTKTGKEFKVLGMRGTVNLWSPKMVAYFSRQNLLSPYLKAITLDLDDSSIETENGNNVISYLIKNNFTILLADSNNNYSPADKDTFIDASSLGELAKSRESRLALILSSEDRGLDRKFWLSQQQPFPQAARICCLQNENGSLAESLNVAAAGASLIARISGFI